MKNLNHLLYVALFLSGLVLIAGCKKEQPTAPKQIGEQSLLKSGDDDGDDDKDDDDTGVQLPFADAEVFFEFNSTDNDLGFQLFLDAVGWKEVKVFDPDGDKILKFNAKGVLKELGITELRFESAEPSPAEVLALFQPGDYEFTGRTVNGDRLVGTATLSQDLPPAPTFSPSNGEVVDASATTIEWDTPGAELVEVIISDPDLGLNLDVIVAGETTSLDVPPQFLRPGTEYTIEVLSISENGNKTITQSTFKTLP